MLVKISEKLKNGYHAKKMLKEKKC